MVHWEIPITLCELKSCWASKNLVYPKKAPEFPGLFLYYFFDDPKFMGIQFFLGVKDTCVI